MDVKKYSPLLLSPNPNNYLRLRLNPSPRLSSQQKVGVPRAKPPCL